MNGLYHLLFYYHEAPEKNALLEKDVRNLFTEKKKCLHLLMLVGDLGINAFIKLFSCWHFCISGVGS